MLSRTVPFVAVALQVTVIKNTRAAAVLTGIKSGAGGETQDRSGGYKAL